MIEFKRTLTVPEFRERSEVYSALGYRVVSQKEKGYKTKITFKVEDKYEEHFHEIHRFEKSIYRKGPSFLPIIFLVIAAFALITVYVVLMADRGQYFDIVPSALEFLLPAGILLISDVIYTYFYFSINLKLVKEPKPNIDDIKTRVEQIISK